MANLPTPFERFVQGILPENPVYRQFLGLCPTLAVTNGLKPALTMALAVGFVLLCANVIVSLIRNLLKPHLRIVVFTLTIATFVTIVDRVLAAYMYQMSKTLGPYIPLIIVNCIIICRCEVCASRQPVTAAAADAVGQSIGFGLALASIAVGAGNFGNRHAGRISGNAGCLACLGDHGAAARGLLDLWPVDGIGQLDRRGSFEQEARGGASAWITCSTSC